MKFKELYDGRIIIGDKVFDDKQFNAIDEFFYADGEVVKPLPRPNE